jgi:lysophospholipase L1-like esterase
MKNLLASISLVLVSVLIVFAGIECYTRWSIDTGMNYHLEMWKYAIRVKQIASNPSLGHEHAPARDERLMGVRVQTNTKKLRNRDLQYEKPAGTTRILMLGDSLTFGWGVPEEETVARRLETAVNANLASPVEVINSGVGNYNTAMEATYFLAEGHKYSPDIVILNFFINDAEPTPTYGQPNLLEQYSYGWIFLQGSLDGFRRQFFMDQDWKSYYLSLYHPSAPGWTETQSAIVKIAQYCKLHGIRFIITNWPELRVLNAYPFQEIDRQIAAIANRVGAEYLELLPAVQGQNPANLWVTVPDPHPNALANKLFAGFLAEKLLPSLK